MSGNANEGLGSNAKLSQAIKSMARARDGDAFRYLFETCAPRINGYFISRGMRRSCAEDLVQETFAAAWYVADTFDPRFHDPFEWVLELAQQVAADATRVGSERSEVEIDFSLIHTDPRGPDHSIESGQRRAALRGAINSLASSEAGMLRTVFIEGKSHTLAAKELGVPLGTLKSNLWRILQKLRRGLGAGN